MIYLDYNATTPIHPEVLDAMMPYLTEHFGNPSSSHALGQRARHGIEVAREQVAALIGAHPDEIYFTSGGTEANNLALSQRLGDAKRSRVVTSVVEHPATSKPLARQETLGEQVTALGVDRYGRVVVDDARGAIDKTCRIVSVMHANNEVGTLQPIAELAELAREAGALMHTDAAQTIGKIPVRVEALGVDMLTIVGHKFYAPKGVGALYARRGVELRSILFGAGHERGVRPGTENVAGIVGLGHAAALAAANIEAERARLASLRDTLQQALTREIPGLVVNGHPEHRLPQTLHVCFPGIIGAQLLAGAPEVFASTGAACHGPDDPPSATLVAMGLDAKTARGAVRLSLGSSSDAAFVDEAAAMLVRSWKSLVGGV